MHVGDVVAVVGEGVDEVLGLGAAGADEDGVAGADELHGFGGGLDAVGVVFGPGHGVASGGLGFDADACVDGDGRGAGRADHEGVDVHLLNLWELGDELAESLECFGECVEVDAFSAACAGEQVVGACGFEHLACLFVGEGGEVEGDVFEDFDEDAAHAEHHQRAEARVAFHAEDDLHAGGAHLLDDGAEDLGVGFFLRDAEHHQVVGVADLGGVVEADAHAAAVGLVGDVRRPDLHDDGVADLVGDGDGLVGGGGHAALGRDEAVGGEDLLGFHLADLEFVAAEGAFDDALGAVSVDGVEADDAFGSVQPALAVDHGAERGDGGVGAGVDRQRAGVEHAVGFGDGVGAHEGGEDGLAGLLGVEFDQGVCGFDRLGHGLRGEQDEDGVDAGVFEGEFGGDGVAVGEGVAEDVDGVVHVGGGGSAAESFSSVSGVSLAKMSSARSISSAAMMPAPPALVTTATREPGGRGWRLNAWARSNCCLTEAQRMTPARSKADS